MPDPEVSPCLVSLAQPVLFFTLSWCVAYAINVSPMAPGSSPFPCTPVPSHPKPLWLSGHGWMTWVMDIRWDNSEICSQSIGSHGIEASLPTPVTCSMLHLIGFLPSPLSFHIPLSVGPGITCKINSIYSPVTVCFWGNPASNSVHIRYMDSH